MIKFNLNTRFSDESKKGIVIMGLKQKCIICGNADAQLGYDMQNNQLSGYQYYHCPLCGRYIIPESSYFLFNNELSQGQPNLYDKVKLGKYLIYNKIENRNAFIGTQNDFNSYIKIKPDSEALLVTKETVEIWYPKTFAEKIDYILLNLSKHTVYDGDYISIHVLDDSIFYSGSTSKTISENDKIDVQFDYVAHYLKDNDLINGGGDFIQLTPKALDRIYELQKYQANNKNVFVAMKFGKETDLLREKIKEGLKGYNVRIMDEIEHNHQIVPEMLYEIRNSKFVIAELSNHNNGAYYEAGYALGLGKEVIHICKKSELSNGLHFDVAQVNTIVYEDMEEIPEKLKKRIQATIR